MIIWCGSDDALISLAMEVASYEKMAWQIYADSTLCYSMLSPLLAVTTNEVHKTEENWTLIVTQLWHAVISMTDSQKCHMDAAISIL